jgi:hypothetical protein
MTYNYTRPGMMGLLAAAAMLAGLPNTGHPESAQTAVANAKLQTAEANKITPKAQANVEVGQRYRAATSTGWRKPKGWSKGPPGERNRGKTNKRKAQLKAKRRRSRSGK